MTASKIVKPAEVESPHSDSRALERGVETMVGSDIGKVRADDRSAT